MHARWELERWEFSENVQRLSLSDHGLQQLQADLGTKIFRVFGGAYEPVMYGVVVLSASWVFLYLLYRRKLFIRV